MRAEPSYSAPERELNQSLKPACVADRQDYHSLRKQALHLIHNRTYLRN